ncbi:hypothetical protein BHE90_017395 [Fusarium euwallaceae]|uniref:Uncharacterized protein n=1 Tax=Fusarium euwallaceae TaxID=1147111 RepID=A0A430KXK7_9HYPO|nr:hypothetical protein BHE90_017395 [Fusarium euwallaceae]
MKFQKIKTNAQDLAQECKEATGSSPSLPTWATHNDGDDVSPDNRTIAIVVDLSQTKEGAVKIFSKPDDHYEGAVLMTDRGHLVLVPWAENWTYFCVGTPRVAQLKAAELE